MLLCVALVAGCTRYQPVDHAGTSGGPGGRHVVARGETLGEVALRHGVTVSALARANRLRDPDRIYVGQTLVIPEGGRAPRTVVADVVPPQPVSVRSDPPPAAGARPLFVPEPTPRALVAAATPSPVEAPVPAVEPAPREVPPAPAVRAAEPEPARAEAAPLRPARPAAMPVAHVDPVSVRRAAQRRPPPLSGDGFLWPVAGELVNGFGDKPNGKRNDGINVAAPAGTPVVAAEHGVVVYAGDGVAGFGRMVLLRHADGFTTAYAHADRLEVAVGDVVRRGQIVARVGSTGVVGEPQLHFELRSGKTPMDPLRFLTGRPSVVAGGQGNAS